VDYNLASSLVGHQQATQLSGWTDKLVMTEQVDWLLSILREQPISYFVPVEVHYSIGLRSIALHNMTLHRIASHRNTRLISVLRHVTPQGKVGQLGEQERPPFHWDIESISVQPKSQP
jgi:hypothetical protein